MDVLAFVSKETPRATASHELATYRACPAAQPLAQAH